MSSTNTESTYKIEIPDDFNDNSFTSQEDETIVIDCGTDLEKKNLNCDLVYEHIFTNDGKSPEENKKTLNADFRKAVKKNKDIFELHKLYRKCSKLSYKLKDQKLGIFETATKFNNNEFNFKTLEKVYIFEHNKKDFLPTYTNILQSNLKFINHLYNMYTYRKLILVDIIIELSNNKITKKNIFTLKCNDDIKKIMNM